jgi:enoyl-CoA hydratase/carnithine racemase
LLICYFHFVELGRDRDFENSNWNKFITIRQILNVDWLLKLGIVEVRLDRPEAKNAIGKEMLKGIQRAIEIVNGDSSTNVVMLSSSVPRVFCAGADLKVS